MRRPSELVQALLVSIGYVGLQAYNMRDQVSSASGICAAAAFFGVYFLSELGVKSLSADGEALWITLTWPYSLEDLLHAKARLWAVVATLIIAPALVYAVWSFPRTAWSVALFAPAWFVFVWSQSEKAVTFVQAPSTSESSGRGQLGRRWATYLGTASFALGVGSGQWPLAIAGIVYSRMTAAAMWQNLRARLPYLYDPWSETPPNPPTLTHAMVAISALVETAAVPIVILEAFGAQGVALALGYGLSAAVVSAIMVVFLHNRGVSLDSIWVWTPCSDSGPRLKGKWHSRLQWTLVGVASGAVLGLLGLLYLAALRQFPEAAQSLNDAEARGNDIRLAMLIVGVLFAPLAEEFLFRGLLFRSLEREWGTMRAAFGSAALFAIYHPFLSWTPAFVVGFANALIFKRTGASGPPSSPMRPTTQSLLAERTQLSEGKTSFSHVPYLLATEKEARGKHVAQFARQAQHDIAARRQVHVGLATLAARPAPMDLIVSTDRGLY